VTSVAALSAEVMALGVYAAWTLSGAVAVAVLALAVAVALPRVLTAATAGEVAAR
jgi:hypothetical protein